MVAIGRTRWRAVACAAGLLGASCSSGQDVEDARSAPVGSDAASPTSTVVTTTSTTTTTTTTTTVPEVVEPVRMVPASAFVGALVRS